MSIVRIDPEGRRNAEHIAIIIVVDLVPIQSHFRSRRPQAQQPLSQDTHTATGPAHLRGPAHVSGGASAVIGKPQLTKPCVVITFLRLRRAPPLFGS